MDVRLDSKIDRLLDMRRYKFIILNNREQHTINLTEFMDILINISIVVDMSLTINIIKKMVEIS